jgi:hypothetical protein
MVLACYVGYSRLHHMRFLPRIAPGGDGFLPVLKTALS